MKLLNVGGNSKNIGIPPHYEGFEHLLLDIDPTGQPDICCDARELSTLPGGNMDAIYCSHNLEHYYWHDVARVLNGFHHMLRDGGMIEIRVPDIKAVMEAVVNQNLELTDPLYQSAAGPIAALDVLYGWRLQIERSGQEFFAHKTGFSKATLLQVIQAANFSSVYEFPQAKSLEVHLIAFKGAPSAHFARVFDL